MKNSTQITFAFQDPPDSGENPGVGVRIKSLKKAAAEVSKDEQARTRLEEPAVVTAGEASVEDSVGGKESPGLKGENSIVDNSYTSDNSITDDVIAETGGSSADPGTGNIESAVPEQAMDEAVFFQSGQSAALADEGQAGTEIDITGINRTDGGIYLPAGTASGSDNLNNPDTGTTVENATDLNLPVNASKSTRGRKSLKTIDEGAELINIPPDEILFQKQYYAIGEVAEMFHVNQSLLRFWETEFDIIQPRKNRKGDRHFRPVDIKNLLLIHDLLRRRKLTIEGAKDFLKKNKRSPERFAMIQSLQKIKGFLLEIKATL